MRRSRTVDWLLLATLLSVWLVIQGYVVRERLHYGSRTFPFGVTGAQGAAGHPVVRQLNVLDSPLRVGDRVLAAGGIDLRGLSRAAYVHSTAPLLGRPFRVEAERDGRRFEVMVEPAPYPYWPWMLFSGATLVMAGAFFLLRARHWHLSRRFFIAMLLLSSYQASEVGLAYPMSWVGIAALPSGMALTLWRRDGRRVQRRWHDGTVWCARGGSTQRAAGGRGRAQDRGLDARKALRWRRGRHGFVGSIRASDRFIWTAVGSTTNLVSRLQAMTRELDASIAIDETTRERAGYVCESFVSHADVAIRGRTGRFDVFALPMRHGR